MSTFAKWLLLLLLLSSVFGEAQTINAASCSATDVQKAFNSVTSSTTTVNIPGGTCHWTFKAELTIPPDNTSLSVIGAGTCTGTPAFTCNDSTVIVDDDTTDSDRLLGFATNSNKAAFARLSGITIRGGTGTHKNNGVIAFGGSSQRLRVDHMHWDCTPYGHGENWRFTGAILGVVDHIVVDSNGASSCGFDVWNGATLYGDSSGNANQVWAHTTDWGTDQFLYFENSTYNNPSTTDHSINDCTHGGKYVFRHNTFNKEGIQTHATGGAGEARGCRAQEVYQNTFNGNNTYPNYRANYIDSGTALIWGNSAQAGYNSFIALDNDRSWGAHQESPPPNGWGYCGTNHSGTGSAWDQNTNTADGYACLDQPGRGQSDLLTGSFPNKLNSLTGTIRWPHQKQEPIYEWLNSWAPTGKGGAFVTVFQSPIAQNRDYYVYTTSFNGTSGVGSGPLTARPSACTAGIGGNAPGVAYWATDTNTLYVCTATNAWTAYYTPYTYPHPLAQALGTTNPPPPTGLQAVVT